MAHDFTEKHRLAHMNSPTRVCPNGDNKGKGEEFHLQKRTVVRFCTYNNPIQETST